MYGILILYIYVTCDVYVYIQIYVYVNIYIYTCIMQYVNGKVQYATKLKNSETKIFIRGIRIG